MKISSQIKWMGVGCFLYGCGALLLWDASSILFVKLIYCLNILCGFALIYKQEAFIKIIVGLLWLVLVMVNSFPFGGRTDFGISMAETANLYARHMMNIVFLLWFLRRLPVHLELYPNDTKIRHLKHSLGHTLLWWSLIIFFTAGIWIPLLRGN